MSFWDDLENYSAKQFGIDPNAINAPDPSTTTSMQANSPVPQVDPGTGHLTDAALDTSHGSTLLDNMPPATGQNLPLPTPVPQQKGPTTPLGVPMPDDGDEQQTSSYIDQLESGKVKFDPDDPALISWVRQNYPGVPANASDQQISDTIRKISDKLPDDADPAKILRAMDTAAQAGVLQPALQQSMQVTEGGTKKAPPPKLPSQDVTTGQNGEIPNYQSNVQPQAPSAGAPQATSTANAPAPTQQYQTPNFGPNWVQAIGAGINNQPGGAAATLSKEQADNIARYNAEQSAQLDNPNSPASQLIKQQLIKLGGFTPEQLQNVSGNHALAIGKELTIPIQQQQFELQQKSLPTVQQADGFNALESGKTTMDQIAQTAQKIKDKGLTISPAQTAAQTFMMQHPLISSFGGFQADPDYKRLIQLTDAGALAGIHGNIGRVTQLEINKFSPDYINANTDADTLIANAKAAKDEITQKENTWINSQQQTGKNLTGYSATANSPASSAQPVPQPNQQQSSNQAPAGMVIMKDPQGIPHYVKSSKVAAAQQAHWTLS